MHKLTPLELIQTAYVLQMLNICVHRVGNKNQKVIRNFSGLNSKIVNNFSN